MNSSGSATPVSDAAGVEGSIAGPHTHQGQLVRQERDVGGGGRERVHVRERVGRYYGIHVPLVEGHCRVGLVGAVEGGIGAHWGTNVGVIYSNSVYGWNTYTPHGEMIYRYTCIYIYIVV